MVGSPLLDLVDEVIHELGSWIGVSVALLVKKSILLVERIV